MLPETLNTENLTIGYITPSDTLDLWDRLFRDKNSNVDFRFNNRGQVNNWVRLAQADYMSGDYRFLWAIRFKSSLEPIGVIQFTKSYGISYIIAAGHDEIAVEAVKAVVDFIFMHTYDLYVKARCPVEDEAANCVFRDAGLVQSFVTIGVIDMQNYIIFRNDWSDGN